MSRLSTYRVSSRRGAPRLRAPNPYRSDYVLSFLVRFTTGNPLLLGFGYVGVCAGVAVVLCLLSGSAYPVGGNGRVELFEDYHNLILYSVLIPVCVVLILNFYRQVSEGIREVVRTGPIEIPRDTSKAQFLKKIDRSVNRAAVVWLPALIAVVAQLVIASRMRSQWNDLSGGAPAMWARLIAIVNTFVFLHVFFKGAIVVGELRKLFDNEVKPQPLHPDGCGGLLPLGRISIALNYFICVFAVHIGVLIFVQKSPLQHASFVPLVVLFAICAILVFFAPLAKAHNVMRQQRTRTLHILNGEFQATYSRVESNLRTKGIALEDAQKIESLERLYRIASRMPVWPIDMRIMVQFFVAAGLPLLLGLGVELLKHLLPPSS